MTQHQLFVVLCWILAVVAGFALGKMIREWRNTRKGAPRKKGIDMSQYKNLNAVHDRMLEKRARKLQEEAKKSADYGHLTDAANAVRDRKNGASSAASQENAADRR